jgi:trehalose-6-phosphate synthase
VAAQAGRAGDRAVILVGRDTGSAAALEDFSADGIVAIDPFDLKGMTAALIAALDGAPGRISDRLVAFVREHDASAWATAFLQDLEASRC